MPARRSDQGWIRGPLWDVGLLAFGWLPFYAWLAAGPLVGGEMGLGWSQAFGSALFVALLLNFLHRHYVFLMVYGDRETFRERGRAYLLAPAAVFAVVVPAIVFHVSALVQLVVAVVAGWNVWHVVMQRYGMLRIYAGKAGGGLEDRAQARRDRALLWSLVALTACALLKLRTGTFAAYPQTRELLVTLTPYLDNPASAALAIAVFAVTLFVIRAWIRGEAAARPRGSRAPRLIFVASTIALLAVFVVHGPVVGYLCFGVAHSVEYVAFVHHFGERRYADGARPGLASRLLGTLAAAPLVAAPLLIAYALLYRHRFASAYVAYYSSTALLHFLFDGWIWKVRKSAVSRPLGVEQPAPAPAE